MAANLHGMQTAPQICGTEDVLRLLPLATRVLRLILPNADEAVRRLERTGLVGRRVIDGREYLADRRQSERRT